MKDKHVDLKFMKIIAKLKTDEFKILLPMLTDKAVDIICSLLNYLLRNPNLHFKNRKKLKKLILDNEEIIRQIASDVTAGRLFKKKRKLVVTGGFPLLAIISAAIPSLLSAIIK